MVFGLLLRRQLLILHFVGRLLQSFFRCRQRLIQTGRAAAKRSSRAEDLRLRHAD